MLTLKQITVAFGLGLVLLTTAAAQQINAPVQGSSLTITAAAAGDRVRIGAPASIVQLHVEIYAASGEKIFDQEIRGGNVFDWLLQNGQGERVTPGSYISVVTAKSVSGRLTQKIGSVNVEEKSANVQAATFHQLTTMQAQAIGPVEENSSWMVAGTEGPQTPTVIAHDGKDGQMIRGRGALSFRIGNFFTGNDREQMRLTEDGRLGIGTVDPRATLDVAGTIRAQNIFVVRPKKTGDADATSQSTDIADSIQPLTSGSGTANRVAKWIDALGTLGDSGITESSTGFVGIGTSNPTQRLHLFSPGATDNILQTFQNGTRNWSIGVNGVSDFFRISDNTAGVARLTILNNGYVGIGTTTPLAKLHVNQTIGYGLYVTQQGADAAVFGNGNYGAGVSGQSTNGYGVNAYSINGDSLHASSDSRAAVLAETYSGKAVYGLVKPGYAQYGGYSAYFEGRAFFTGPVGIGGASRGESLEVFGNIKLGTNADLQATSGEEKLRIIRGTVAADGTVITGGGFTVAIAATGVYTITFTNPFAGSHPTITATPEFTSNPAFMMTDGSDRNFVTLKIFRRSDGAATAEAFHFIAIGTR